MESSNRVDFPVSGNVIRRAVSCCLAIGLYLGGGLVHSEPVADDWMSAPAIRSDFLQDLWSMARIDREAGRLRDAIELLQAILAQRPELHRVRLELALVAYEYLDYSLAREELERLLDSPDLSDRVRAAVSKLLGKVESAQSGLQQPHSWLPSLTFGLLYDDNVNVGPVSDLVEIDDQLFSVKPEFQPRGDWGTVLRGNLAHQYRFSGPWHLGQRSARLFWNTRATVSRKAFRNEKDFNLDILSVRSGPKFEVPGGLEGSLSFRTDYVRFGGEDYSLFYSVSPALAWKLNSVEWSYELTLMYKDYFGPAESSRNADYRASTLRVDFSLEFIDSKAYLGGRISREDARNLNYSYDGLEVFAGVTYQPNPDWAVSFDARRRSIDYQGEVSLFRASREDDQVQLSLNLKYRLPDVGDGMASTLEAGHVFIDRKSSIPLYAYKRNMTYLAVRLAF